MKSFQGYVNHIHALLDQLVLTATQLREASLHVVSEEELVPLQRQQEDILAQLQVADHELQKQYSSAIQESVHEQFKTKLQTFQLLNEEFISHLNSSHGLIQFELRQLEEKEELPANLSHLNLSFSEPPSGENPKSKDKKLNDEELKENQ